MLLSFNELSMKYQRQIHFRIRSTLMLKSYALRLFLYAVKSVTTQQTPV